ncbi:LVIVD repeat-containing protein [Carboxylicivirga sp. RSCT41]|uniref:LVIVD repeat-containing protein n=1 Tax=Carboxylicivirga agarovorans TaxID=3417570 RepID=UPI003D33C3A9
MKQVIITICIALTVLSCSEDSSNPDSSNTDGQGGSLATFTLKGEYLYVVDEFDLNVFSVSKVEEPVLVNKVPVGFNIETLFSFKDYLYIGSRNGMFIYSLSNPEFPEMLSGVQHFTACDPVIANDTHAFVTLHSNTMCGNNINLLEIYDISKITEPVLVSSRNLISPKGLGLYGNYLIVCDDEVKIFDISDPNESKLINSINIEAFDVIIRGNTLIAIGDDGLYQLELENTQTGLSYSTLSTIAL